MTTITMRSLAAELEADPASETSLHRALRGLFVEPGPPDANRVRASPAPRSAANPRAAPLIGVALPRTCFQSATVQSRKGAYYSQFGRASPQTAELLPTRRNKSR